MKKKKVVISVIATLLFLAIVIGLAFLIASLTQKGKSNNTSNTNTNSNSSSVTDNSAKIAEKGWDSQIVTNLASNDVPIPSDFSIAQDGVNSGVIIQDNNFGTKFLFIPYQENVNIDTSEYYANINTVEVESDVLSSIKKYGGFFVLLNSGLEMDDLKTISQEDYNTQAEQMHLSSYSYTSANSHILSKDEIAQILAYVNNINLGENTIGAQALVVESFSNLDVTVDETQNVADSLISSSVKVATATDTVPNSQKDLDKTVKNSDSGYVYMLESDFYPTDVPIPSGFKYCVTDGVVSIQDSSNSNLIYVWVPLSIQNDEDIKNSTIKNALKTIYQNYTDADGDKYSFAEDTELYKVFNDTTETLTEEHIESIKKYGGFYLSEAELGYDSNNEYYNKARGMIEYSATNTINGGDYYRDTTSKGLTFDKMNEIANSVYEEDASVNSHLVYGIEYDAAMLWIANTYSNYNLMGDDINTILIANSTNVGKYSNSNLGANSTIFESSVYFNGLWGLGGNLAEVTQERYNDQYILRGGSFTTTGEDAPMASRKISDTTQGDNIGFRTALYVKPDLARAKKADTYEQQYVNDTVTLIDNIEFNLMGNVTRWTNNWSGAAVYEKPDVNSKVLTTLPFASELTINAKAKEAITLEDGKQVTWVRALASNDQYVYLNANDMTDSSEIIGDDITFVRGSGVTRYYDSGTTFYESPDEDSNKILTTTYVGAITAIGKSSDQTWTIINVNGTEGFILSNDLRVEANTKEVNNIKFVVGENQTRYVLQDNSVVYTLPGNNTKLTTLKYADTVTIHAKSEDGTWAEVTVNGSIGYINCNLLTTEKLEPKPETKPQTGNGNGGSSKPSTPAKDPTPSNEQPKSSNIKITRLLINYDQPLKKDNVITTATRLYMKNVPVNISFESNLDMKDLVLTVNHITVNFSKVGKDSKTGNYKYSAVYTHSRYAENKIDISIRPANGTAKNAVKRTITVQHILMDLSMSGNKLYADFPLSNYLKADFIANLRKSRKYSSTQYIISWDSKTSGRYVATLPTLQKDEYFFIELSFYTNGHHMFTKKIEFIHV